jgi:DNA-binding winged helix-turn-helix (wHTH) protein
MRFQFLGYVLEADASLRLEGHPVRLPPKARQLLKVLVQAEGRVVSRDELAASLWPGVDVSDDSIARAVSRLRRALQAAGGEDVVETLYGEGFRLGVPVQRGRPDTLSTSQGVAQSREPAAIEALFTARELAARRGPTDLEAAVACVTRALDLDPEFVSAWSTLAELRAQQVGRNLVPGIVGGPWVIAAAERALALNPRCAPALALRGWVKGTVLLDVDGGLHDLDAAEHADDAYWATNVLKAWTLTAAGRPGDAATAALRALQQHPVGLLVNGLPALYLLLADRRTEALARARDLAAQFSTTDNALAIASTVAAVHDLHDEAIAYGREAARLGFHTPNQLAPLAYAFARAGQADSARGVLQQMSELGDVPAYISMAPVHLALGDKAQTLECLAQGLQAGEPQFAWSRFDPRLIALRSAPAAQALWSRLRRGVRSDAVPDSTASKDTGH